MAGALEPVNRQRIIISCFNRSGLWHYTSQLVNALAQTNQWEILVLTSTNNPQPLIAPHSAVRLVALPAPHSPFPFVVATLQHIFQRPLVRLITDFKPDVIHILDSYPWYLLYGSLWKRYPLCVTIHDPVSHEGEKLGSIVTLMNKYLIHRATQVIVHGQALREALQQPFNISIKKIAVIPHGNYAFFKQWAQGITPQPNSLLFFGRLLPYKGLNTLITACQILQQQHVSFKLSIAGEGNWSALNLKIPVTLQPFITLDNRYIPDQEVAQIFEAHQLVVVPYHEATQSGVIPIAFSLKRPVIATNVGALGEVVQHQQTGWLIPPDDPAALANAIRYLLTHPDIQQHLTERAYQQTQQHLSWQTIAAQYDKCYRSSL